jgi:hypothetical protein
MNSPAYVETYLRLKNTKKYVAPADLTVVLVEQTPGRSTKGPQFSATLPVFDRNQRKLEKCEILIEWRESTRTEWVACFKVAGKTVAKIDVEREEKLIRPPIKELRKGRLNSRRPQRIPAYTPHWQLLDPETGTISSTHHVDLRAFPTGMPVDQAIPKFFKTYVATEWPPGVTFYTERKGDRRREKLPPKRLFKK